MLPQGHEAHSLAGCGGGQRLGKPPGDGVHFGLRLFESHIGFESGQRLVKRIVAAGVRYHGNHTIQISGEIKPPWGIPPTRTVRASSVVPLPITEGFAPNRTRPSLSPDIPA